MEWWGGLSIEHRTLKICNWGKGPAGTTGLSDLGLPVCEAPLTGMEGVWAACQSLVVPAGFPEECGYREVSRLLFAIYNPLLPGKRIQPAAAGGEPAGVHGEDGCFIARCNMRFAI